MQIFCFAINSLLIAGSIMSVYFNKRRARWMYDFEVGGRRVVGYCLDSNCQPVQSRRAANEAEGVAKRTAHIAPTPVPASDLTFAEAVASLAPNWVNQSDVPNKDRYAREPLQFFGPSTPIKLIGDIRVQEYVRFMRERPILIWAGGPTRKPDDPKNKRFWKIPQKPKSRSPATINQYLNLLRQIFAQALKFRDPITGDPIICQVPEVKELDVPKRKARPVPEVILQDVLSTVPPHVVEAITATLYFGFRKGEAFRLQIRHIDFQIGGVRFFAEEVKDDEDEFLPGAPEAMAYLRKLVDQARERGTAYLISWKRHRRSAKAQAEAPWVPIQNPKSAWRPR
jgi:integrase